MRANGIAYVGIIHQRGGGWVTERMACSGVREEGCVSMSAGFVICFVLFVFFLCAEKGWWTARPAGLQPKAFIDYNGLGIANEGLKVRLNKKTVKNTKYDKLQFS